MQSDPVHREWTSWWEGRVCEELGRRLREIAEVRIFDASQVILWQGERVEGLVVMGSGLACRRKEQEDGSARIVRWVGRGNWIGLAEIVRRERCGLELRAWTQCVVEWIPRQRLVALVTDEEAVLVELLDRLSREYVELEGALRWEIASKAAAERVMDALGEIAGLCGETKEDGVVVRLRLRVEDVAERVGMSRQWVSTILGELEADGRVKRWNRDVLWLKAREGTV